MLLGLIVDKGISHIMSTRAPRGAAVRSYRRRKTALDLDLNSAPPGENREQEGPQEVQASHQPAVEQPTMIDVEAIDDDVVESSPRAFAEVYLVPSIHFIAFYTFRLNQILLETHFICLFLFDIRLKTTREEIVEGL